MAQRSEYRYPPAIVNHADADIWIEVWRLMNERNRMFSAVIVGKPE